MLQSNGYFENPFFSIGELRCKGSGDFKLAPGFLGMLINLRMQAGKPFIVNSCCRSPEYNKEIKGHPRSLHLTDHNRGINGTLAIDISVSDWPEEVVDTFIKEAGKLGWSTGRAKSFIHLDARILLGLSRTDFTY